MAPAGDQSAARQIGKSRALATDNPLTLILISQCLYRVYILRYLVAGERWRWPTWRSPAHNWAGRERRLDRLVKSFCTYIKLTSSCARRRFLGYYQEKSPVSCLLARTALRCDHCSRMVVDKPLSPRRSRIDHFDRAPVPSAYLSTSRPRGNSGGSRHRVPATPRPSIPALHRFGQGTV